MPPLIPKISGTFATYSYLSTVSTDEELTELREELLETALFSLVPAFAEVFVPALETEPDAPGALLLDVVL